MKRDERRSSYGGGGGGNGGGAGGKPNYYSRSKTVYDGKTIRKAVVRKTIDFNASVLRYIQNRSFERDHRDRLAVQPTIDYTKEFQPLFRHRNNPSYGYLTKYVSVSINKIRCPINVVTWTPQGRRVITGAASGEFTLWNGLTFNFETLLQAHDHAVRSIKWSKNDQWMISADDAGIVKYWQESMKSIKVFKGHRDPIRDLSFSPSDMKFASCSDDKIIKVWDFERCVADVEFDGHGWDVKACEWHPQKSLILSGSKDSLIKLWDPRSKQCLKSLYGHKNTISKVKWNQNGHWFLSGARDQLIRLWDIRTMKSFATYRAHKREITSLEWHPLIENLFVSGSYDGAIRYWITNDESMQAEICGAHEGSVWDLAWHPMGHLLVSGSNDHCTRFWSRNRPGDEMRDRYNANQLPTEDKEAAIRLLAETARQRGVNYNNAQQLAVLEGYDLSKQEDRESRAALTTAEIIPGMGSAQGVLAKLAVEEEEKKKKMQLKREEEEKKRKKREKEQGFQRQRERIYGRSNGSGGYNNTDRGRSNNQYGVTKTEGSMRMNYNNRGAKQEYDQVARNQYNNRNSHTNTNYNNNNSMNGNNRKRDRPGQWGPQQHQNTHNNNNPSKRPASHDDRRNGNSYSRDNYNNQHNNRGQYSNQRNYNGGGDRNDGNKKYNNYNNGSNNDRQNTNHNNPNYNNRVRGGNMDGGRRRY